MKSSLLASTAGGLVLPPHITAPAEPSLSDTAVTTLIALLMKHGNRPNKEHVQALTALVCTMTEVANGKRHGRWAFGLPTGMGKTSAIVAWCAALAKLGMDHVSVAVSASKVEALCQLKRDLVTQGVSPDRIGLIHSKKFDLVKRDAVLRADGSADDHASEPSEGADRQIMLVTHQRVRGCSLDSFNLYRGKPRDLLLYDKSLIVSDSTGIQFALLDGAVAWLLARHRDSDKHQPMVTYLSQCRGMIATELQRQRNGGQGTEPINLPELSEGTVEAFKSLLGRHPVVDPVLQLLEIAAHPLRVIATGQGGVVWYNLSVPPEIKNIVILDASQPIRRLVHLDPTIKDAERHHPIIRRLGLSLSTIKKFDHVTIRQMFAGGGRETMREDFSRDRVEDRRVSREIISVVKDIPETEAAVVFTYKQRPTEKVSYRDILIADMKAAGIDTDATVMINGEQRPRINVLTWGNETSLNRFAYCTHVIMAGVLQRSPIDLAASFLGQTDNLKGDVSHSAIRELQTSESAHLIYQALSRGSCREVVDGYAKPMTAWLIHRDGDVQRELRKVLPGVVWKLWEPKYGKPRGSTIKTLAAKIADHLRGIPAGVDRVSTRKLKEAMDAKDVPSMTWTKALQDCLSNGSEWLLDGRSLVRAAAVFAG